MKNIVMALDENNEAVSILRYQKEFIDGKKKYHVDFGRYDTLYCYYTEVPNEEKTFITGEYLFKGLHLGKLVPRS